jgi:hypothetical protein
LLSHEFPIKGFGKVSRGFQFVIHIERSFLWAKDTELTRLVEIEPSVKVHKEHSHIGSIPDDFVLGNNGVIIIDEDTIWGKEDFVSIDRTSFAYGYELVGSTCDSFLGGGDNLIPDIYHIGRCNDVLTELVGSLV